MDDQTKRMRGGAVEVCPECDIAGCRHIRARATLAAQPEVGQQRGEGENRNTEQERAEFEAWASDEGKFPHLLERVDDYYRFTSTQYYWAGWQARAALASQPVASAEPCFCDRMYPDSNPDASCGDCPTRDYRPAAQGANAAVAAIQFALETDDGMTWLRCWNEGDFDACRNEWSGTPEECFIGADPLHPSTRAALAVNKVDDARDADMQRTTAGDAQPVAWLRNERGEHSGPATLDPLVLLTEPTKGAYRATYTPLYAEPVAAGNERYPQAAEVCAELYQVIGSLAHDLGVFGHTKVVKALDNASEHAMVHDDVLPFPSFSKPTLNDARKIMKKHRDTLKALTAHKEIPSDDQLIALALEVAPDATDEQVKLYGHLWVKLCRLALARYSYGAIVQKADDAKLPAKIPEYEAVGGEYPSNDSYQEGYAEGWNAAIDATIAQQVQGGNNE